MKKKNNKKVNYELIGEAKQLKKKQVKKKTYIGGTFKVSDNDLPHTNTGTNKIVNLAIIDENNLKELAGVRLTTQESKNAIRFKTKHKLYKGYKTFLITEFQDRTPIKANDKRLKENPWHNDLSVANIKEIEDKIYNHSKQSSDNNKKLSEFKNRQKK